MKGQHDFRLPHNLCDSMRCEHIENRLIGKVTDPCSCKGAIKRHFVTRHVFTGITIQKADCRILGAHCVRTRRPVADFIKLPDSFHAMPPFFPV